MRAAGVFGAFTAGIGRMTGVHAGTAAAAPKGGPKKGPGGLQWLAGDHHIYTQYSSDGQYRVLDQAQHGAAYGLDWLVITDHVGATQARIGVDLFNPDIRKAREELPDTLIFRAWSGTSRPPSTAPSSSHRGATKLRFSSSST